MTAVLPVDEFAIADLVAEVFTGLLGEDFEPPYPSAPGPQQLPIAGYLAIRGGWHAEVVVSCSLEAATNLAQQLFLLKPANVTGADLRDVIGELANVIGGNLKSLMPGPSALSLPQTALDGTVEGVYQTEILRLDLSWSGQPLRLIVLQPSLHPEENQ